MADDTARIRSYLAERIHIDRLLIRKKIRGMQDQVSGVLLDIGCGKQPYRHEFARVQRYLGLDRTETAEIVHDLAAYPYPLSAGAADWILCTQVLDDMPDQDAFIRELHRLLAARGGLVLSCSFVWELHDLPHDYGRPSPERLRLLLEGNGFDIVDLQHVGNSWTTLGQVININLLNILSKRSWWFRLISPFLFINSLLFYAAGLICGNQQAARLPLGFFVVAKKK